MKTYVSYMSNPLTISEVRRDLAKVIDDARKTHEPVFVSRRGRRVAAVVDADDYDELRTLADDMADIIAAEQARDEMRRTGDAPIPWDEVKAELGLT